MLAINHVIGRLGHDIELHFTQKQIPVCTLSVAESRSIQGTRGQWSRVSVWHNFTVWGKMAKRAEEILHKGSLAVFQYRIDYEKAGKKNGDGFEAPIPRLVLTRFVPLADYNPINMDD